ncbi:MAG: caspase family protein [Elusimicrobia bacterium]|nr:caspase family protein [Elusimicrobiota bacterium]
MNRLLAALVLALPFASGCISIHQAGYDGKNRDIQAVLDKGVPVDKRNLIGSTALMFAAEQGHPDTVRFLLDHGADPRLTDNSGRTALARAQAANRDAAVIAMLERALGKAPSSHAEAPGPERRAPSSDVDSPSRHGAPRPDDFALVIGIEDYQSLPKADFGARDAATVRRHFESMGVPARNIISLEGSQATGSKLKNYLQQWLPRNVKPESTVFVYYSGHGAPDPENGDAYLVPWDADPMFLTTSAYPLKQFYAELSKLKAKRVLVALDACFSGSGGRSVLAKGARPLVAKVDESVPAAANLTVLAAASGAEITGSLDEQGHGIFTYHFLKALQGGAATPRGLYDYLKPRVQDDARRQNREQSPTLAGSGADAKF